MAVAKATVWHFNNTNLAHGDAENKHGFGAQPEALKMESWGESAGALVGDFASDIFIPRCGRV